MARLRSLDIFRGLTIASMILVNNPGNWQAIYPPFRHAEWHGWTFTDMVFPFFLWISGVAMTLSFGRRVEHGADRGQLLLHTARRAASIFALGLLLNLIPKFDFAHVRIPGVLQRIGLCYFFATIAFLYLSPVGLAVLAFALLAVYGGLMLYAPFPGMLEDRWGVAANFARYVDGIVLEGHMWRQSKYWDPEGLLSTIPAIATVLFGVMAGRALAKKDWQWLWRMGVPLTLVGLALNVWIPINKSLWTPSFVLLMAGLAAIVYGGLYAAIEREGWTRGTEFFAIFGTNAIVSFVFSGIVGRVLSLTHVGDKTTGAWLYETVFAPLAAPEIASLLYALANVGLSFLLVWWMYRRKILVRL